MRLTIPARQTLWGRIEFALYVAPDGGRRHRVAVVGRAGTTIIDDLAELDEFDHEPRTSGQVSGQIVFESLQQTAGRRAVLRDRDAFPVFRDAVASIEDVVSRTVDRVRASVDSETTDRLSDTVRRVFQRVLKELADLDNPMRTLVSNEPGDDDGLFSEPSTPRPPAPQAGADRGPTLDELEARPPTTDDTDRPSPGSAGSGDRARTRNLPSIAPDPDPGHERSRFDTDAGVVLYNDRHADSTTSSSKATNQRSSTTSPPSSPRSTSSTTTQEPPAATSPKRWSACSSASAATSQGGDDRPRIMCLQRDDSL